MYIYIPLPLVGDTCYLKMYHSLEVLIALAVTLLSNR